MNMSSMTSGLPPLTASRILNSWVDRPFLLALLIAIAITYAYATQRASTMHPGEPWPIARTVSFMCGLVVVAIALTSFIGVYDTTLFWIHMVQHLMLIMVAPALLAGGGLEKLALQVTHGRIHERLESFFQSPVLQALTSLPCMIVLYAGIIVGTHLTGLMNTIMASNQATDLEHLAYLVVGYLYFLPVFSSWPNRIELSLPARLLMIVLTMPVDAFTGVVLTMSNQMMFPRRSWSPSPVTDLHWGGAVMWLGGSLIMTTFIFAIGIQWARTPEKRANDSGGLLARARFEHLLGDIEGLSPDQIDLDEDERVLHLYNEQLSRRYGNNARH